jgi:hypothetical protein
MPEYRGDSLTASGSISLLTLPGDRGDSSVTVYHSPKDKSIRKVLDAEVFERLVRSMPLHAHWLDGEPVSQVYSMAAVANTSRDFVEEGRPLVTGLVPTCDAWGYINLSLGRGICLGVCHAVDLVDVIAENLDRPSVLAEV